MKKLSTQKLADTILSLRKSQKISQQELADRTGINRALISRIEGQAFTPRTTASTRSRRCHR